MENVSWTDAGSTVRQKNIRTRKRIVTIVSRVILIIHLTSHSDYNMWEVGVEKPKQMEIHNF